MIFVIWISSNKNILIPLEVFLEPARLLYNKPHETAHFIEDWAKEGFVNIVGGCCGTTPDHIQHIAESVKNVVPRKLPVVEEELV